MKVHRLSRRRVGTFL
jgi:hypothetical protein